MFRSSAKPLSGRYLSLVEREIALLRVQGYSRQAIGRHLGRAASTISRELRRNAATRSGADRSARRPKPTKLALNTTLRKQLLTSPIFAHLHQPSVNFTVPGPSILSVFARRRRREVAIEAASATLLSIPSACSTRWSQNVRDRHPGSQ
ncbi:hypothetical protein ACVILI_006897 [Mesorhizobium sp. USDA 4775]